MAATAIATPTLPTPTDNPTPPDAPLPPLASYLAALGRLYQLRRAPKSGREAGRLETRLGKLRDALAPTERLRADSRERELNDDFRGWLAEQPEGRPSPARSQQPRDERIGGRKRPPPTANLPGTEAKILDMAARRGVGAALTDPADVDEDLDRGLRSATARNGAKSHRGQGAEVVAQREFGTLVASLAGRLARLREAADLTRKALACRAGLSLRCITFLETDRRRLPRMDTLAALATALDTTVDALMGRENRAKTPGGN